MLSILSNEEANFGTTCIAVFLSELYLIYKYINYPEQDGENLNPSLSHYFFIAAATIELSAYSWGLKCFEKITPLKKLCHLVFVVLLSHLALKHIWMNIIYLVMCLFDSVVDNLNESGVACTIDNFLITIIPDKGFVNLFDFMAILLFVSSLVNMRVMEDEALVGWIIKQVYEDPFDMNKCGFKRKTGNKSNDCGCW